MLQGEPAQRHQHEVHLSGKSPPPARSTLCHPAAHLEGVDGKHDVGDALVRAHAGRCLARLEAQHRLEKGGERLLCRQPEEGAVAGGRR